MVDTVVCVLRAGKGFTAEYVTRLRDGVASQWTGALRFVCLTDTRIRHKGVEEMPLVYNWPGYWSKLELFRPDLEDLGGFLYFDLDTMITGALEPIQKHERHTLLQAYKKSWAHRLASGMMYLPAEVRPVIWERWKLNPTKWRRVHKWPNKAGHLPGDQGFLQETWERSGWGSGRKPTRDWAINGIRRWQKCFPGQVLSYKKHIRKRFGGLVPRKCRVVCFHGPPRPHEIGWRLERGT